MKDTHTVHVHITKIHDVIFSGEAVSVTLPGREGEFTILAHHEPLIGLLKNGTITVRGVHTTEKFTIESGILETSNNQVTVLV